MTVLWEPRDFAFVEFVGPYDASKAQYRMNGQHFGGWVLTMVVATERRGRPKEMCKRDRLRELSGYSGHHSFYRGCSHSCSRSRSRSPRYPSSSRNCHQSGSQSPASRQRDDYSASPRKPSNRTRSLWDCPQGHDENHDRRSYSPSHSGANRNHADDGYVEKVSYEAKGTRAPYESPRHAALRPSGCSRSAAVFQDEQTMQVTSKQRRLGCHVQ